MASGTVVYHNYSEYIQWTISVWFIGYRGPWACIRFLHVMWCDVILLRALLSGAYQAPPNIPQAESTTTPNKWYVAYDWSLNWFYWTHMCDLWKYRYRNGVSVKTKYCPMRRLVVPLHCFTYLFVKCSVVNTAIVNKQRVNRGVNFGVEFVFFESFLTVYLSRSTLAVWPILVFVLHRSCHGVRNKEHNS